MASTKDLKHIALQRLQTVRTLMDAQDWDIVIYMMGYVLEAALKAATCKALHLVAYPENTGKKEIDSYFMTHKFDPLLKVSGLEDVFSLRGHPEAFRNWSEFTTEYQGNWPEMRYVSRGWDESKVRKLYTNLVDPNYGIITEIKRRKRW